MNRIEIEQAVLNEIHMLPLDKVEATLKSDADQKAPIGVIEK